MKEAFGVIEREREREIPLSLNLFELENHCMLQWVKWFNAIVYAMLVGLF